jgi:hypothetical protein
MPDRKPLELVVYPKVDRWVKHPHGGGWREFGYETPTGVWDFTLFGPDLFDKRLTDAELAAEYHSWDSLCRREQWIETVQGDEYTERERRGQKRMYDRLNTIYRFATHPHHDEEQDDD